MASAPFKNRIMISSVIALGTVSLLAWFSYPEKAVHANSTAQAVDQYAPPPAPAQGFADIVERVKPAVVNISTSASRSGDGEFRSPYHGGSPQGFMKRYFSPESQDAVRTRSLGSGFIVDPSGYVVTNYHVIEDADEIEVILDSGMRLSADVVGSEKASDLALLKVETDSDLPYVNFGNDTVSRIGDWIIAIGNPFGLGGTTTTGIISARGRDLNTGPYDDFIQIDAPINRGNSGGPLFNLQGEVIGVNSVIYSPNGGNVGIGFAIPATQATRVIDQLKSDGHVSRGWLGVQIQGIDVNLAEALDLESTSGALIASVQQGSPAHLAGLLSGDVVVEFNDTRVNTAGQLPKLVGAAKPGETVRLVVIRGGKRLDIKTRLNDRNELAINLEPGGTKDDLAQS